MFSPFKACQKNNNGKLKEQVLNPLNFGNISKVMESGKGRRTIITRFEKRLKKVLQSSHPSLHLTPQGVKITLKALIQ